METLEQLAEPITEELEKTKSTYSAAHKTYYMKNKDAILTKYKETKPYKSFYDRNKEKLRAKALERYYEKKLLKEMEATPAE